MSEPSPSRPAARVGVREVARAAGVSTQTVSRVINDHPGIRAETRQRVARCHGGPDYRVNNAARALGTSRTRTIGLLASDASMYGPAIGILALEAAARAAGRWVTAAYADAGDEASVVEAARHLSAQGVDGIVVVAPHARTLSALDDARLGLPVVALHGPDASALQRDAARIAVDHLVDAGHARIAHLAGPDDWLEAVARAEGFDGCAGRARARPRPAAGEATGAPRRDSPRPATSFALCERSAARPPCSSRTIRWRSVFSPGWRTRVSPCRRS